MTTAIAVHRIEEQIRAKRADQLRVSEFIPTTMMTDAGAHRYLAESLGRNMAYHMLQKGELRGIPAVDIDHGVTGVRLGREGDTFEANVVVVHPALWAEITALLRSLR